MQLANYLIEHQGVDWNLLMADWRWILPPSFTIWMVNRFGDLILVADDGSVHMLDLGAGSLKQIAKDREDFCVRADFSENADYWFLVSLVDNCVEAGITLQPGECYGFKVPPVLSGKYTIDNVEVCDLEVNFSLMAQIHRQTQDLPDGTKVALVVGP